MNPIPHAECPPRSTWEGSTVVAPQTRNLEQHALLSSSSSSSSSNPEFVSPTTSEFIPQPSPVTISSGMPQSFLSITLPASVYPLHPGFARQGAPLSNSAQLLDNGTASRWFSPFSSDERPALIPMVPTPVVATHSSSSVFQSSPTSTGIVASAAAPRHEYVWPLASRISPQRTSSLPMSTSYSNTTGVLELGSAHTSPVSPLAPAINPWASVPLQYAPTNGTYSNAPGPHYPQHDTRPRIVTTASDDVRRISGEHPTAVTVPLQSSSEAESSESGRTKDFTGPIRNQGHQHYAEQSQLQRHHSSPYPHPSPERTSVMPTRYTAGTYAPPTSSGRTVPAYYVRRRNLVSSAPAVPTATPDQGSAPAPKRKPLPKIYECSDPSCNKKFDRPSTLKVHEAIHTGAKDYLCEYCARAFTVGSNMKRHMRVCKHKALSPPFATCWFLCVPPNSVLVSVTTTHASTSDSSVETLPSATAPQSCAVVNGSTNGATAAPLTLIAPASTREQPTRHYLSSPAHRNQQQQAPYNPHMTASATSLPGPATSTSAAGLQLTVKGEKAPMIIGAMFSAHQKVPNSISHLTLVHLECDIPLPPTRVHPKYAHLHQKAGMMPLALSTYGGHPGATGMNNVGLYIEVTPLNTRKYMSSMVGATSVPNPDHLDGRVGGHGYETESGNESVSENEEENERMKEEEYELVEMDRSMRTSGLLPLPNDLFEDRDSFTPRSRYCYHPAEYDDITVLPGPGVVPIPYEEMEAQATR